MAISKEKKQRIVQDAQKVVSELPVVLFVDIAGMNVARATEMRSHIRESQGVCMVLKKNLLDIALKNAKRTGVSPKEMEGEIAIVCGEDAPSLCKVVYTYHKHNDQQPGLVSGMMDDTVLSSDDIHTLATLPSREELLARAVGSMSAPMSSFVRVCSGPMQSLVYALSALQKQK